MAATRGYSWADLNSEILVSFAAAADGLSLRDYNCLRGVCTAWHSALPPPYPCVLSLADNHACVYSSPASISLDLDPLFMGFFTFDDLRNNPLFTDVVRNRPRVAASSSGNGGFFVFSLPLRRSFHLGMATSSTAHRRTLVVGSGNGLFAIAIDNGKEYHPAKGGINCIFWTTRILLLFPRTGKEVELVPLPMKGYDQRVRKIVFAPDPDDGTVVAMCDGNKIAYIDTSCGDDINWTVIDVVLGSTEHLVDLVFDHGGGKVYCLDISGGLRVLLIPRSGRNKQDVPADAANEPSPPTLVSVPGSAAFAPPYDIVSRLAVTRHLFFCHGSLYQMWQNTSATVNLSNGFTVSADEIFVLRYDPRHCPCWNAVKELGGCSVFLGKNSTPTVVVRAAGGAVVPGVRPDCVYWIDWQGGPMVCDVATGTSKPFADLPYGAMKGSTCWYFDAA